MPRWVVFLATRSLWVYLVVGVIFIKSVDFKRASDQRAKYLLGVFYNGKFENHKDGMVYFNFMRRHHPNNDEHQKGYAYCEQQLKTQR